MTAIIDTFSQLKDKEIQCSAVCEVRLSFHYQLRVFIFTSLHPCPVMGVRE